jgi:hypothetical protein
MILAEDRGYLLSRHSTVSPFINGLIRFLGIRVILDEVVDSRLPVELTL